MLINFCEIDYSRVIFSLIMTQDERWLAQWNEVMAFMAENHRRLSKFIESGGQELSCTHYTPINTIYSLRNRYLSVA